MSAALRIAVVGARGRMGALSCAWIRAEGDLELVAEIERGDDLGAALRRARAAVALDFTTAASARRNALAIVEAGVRPVIGTSGLDPAGVEALRAALRARGLGGVVAPNFSVGAVLAMRFAGEAARWMPSAEIVEAHHASKADAPSGTARATAERIAAARRTAPAGGGEERVAGVRGGSIEGVPVHSLRIPGVVARQEAHFGAEGETLAIRHETTDRSCFRPGVLLALRAAPRLGDLLVGIETLLVPSSP